MIDNKTTNLKLPLPNLANYTKDDVPRLITALQMIDNLLATKALVATKADATETASAINLKADTAVMIEALATKALLNGDAAELFSVLTATDPAHAVPLLQMQERVGSDGGLDRNIIVDGTFDQWTEGTTQTGSGYGSATYWANLHSGSSKTVSRIGLSQGYDLPAIENASYWGYRTVVSSVAGNANFVKFRQSLEGCFALAGKQATVSFYAKSDANQSVALEFYQHFGTNGSTPVSTPIGKVQLSTVWQRYSLTFDVPSGADKVMGDVWTDYVALNFWLDAGSDFDGPASSLGQQSGTFDFALIQLEKGSVATAFMIPAADFDRQCRYFMQGRYSTYVAPNTNFLGANILLPASIRTGNPTITISADGVSGRVQIKDGPFYSSSIIYGVDISKLQTLNLVVTDTQERTKLHFYYVIDCRL